MLSTPLERRQGRLPPPFVSVPGLPNLRDIGGYELPSHLYPPGSSIRKGVLYRSASPHACPPTSLLRLRYELDIRNVFDLRSGPEAAKRGAGAAALDGRLRAAGIKRVWAPVYAKQDTTGLDRISRMRLYGQQGTDGFVATYRNILIKGAPAFRRFFRHLASPTTTSATLIHCIGGKDRTGMAICLLLSFLGLPAEAVAAEYALTELGLRASHAARIKRLLASGAFSGSTAADSPDRAAAERMASARPEFMLDTIEMVEKEWGSAEAYMRVTLRLGDEDLRRLRDKFVLYGAEEQVQ